MSGASALAAAKRRRSKVDSSRTPSNTSNNSRSNTNSNSNSSNSSSMPPRLNVQQSFQYMWQKILQVESMVNNNTTIMKSNTSSNSSNNNFEVNNLRQKINMLENSVRQISSNTSNNTVDVNGEKYVSIEQFNEVMSKVASDMQGITEKVTQLGDYVSNVQNNNVVLRNILDSMQPDNLGFDGSGSIGFNMDNGSSINDDNSIINEEDGDSIVNEEDDVTEDGDVAEDDDIEDTNVSATPDVTNVLEKLKTLNSETIKEEVAAELNNNITLVVEENTNKTTGESTN